MKIYVTQEDINNGTPVSAYSCPIALAIKKALPNYTPCVMSDSIKLVSMDDFSSIANPESVRRFISRFDNSKPVKPFNFILNI